MTQMLRTQFAAPNVIFDKALNTITVRGSAEVVELAEKLIRSWDKPKGEVIDRRGDHGGLAGQAAAAGCRLRRRHGRPALRRRRGPTRTTASWFNLKSLALGQAGSYSVSLPSAYLQILESDSDTKIIAQPRLRGVSDEKITYKVGQKVPIPQTTFQAYAAGGVSNVPVTNFQQQDVGIEINFTPRVHLEKDVTLDAEIKVTSIGGSGYADIPIINNREIKNVVRLRDGETQLIAGLIRDEERKIIKGIPGLKDIPGLGRLFGSETTNIEQTDVIVTITPYVIRTIPRTAEDAKPIWVDVDTAASAAPGGVFDDSLLDRGAEADAAQQAAAEAAGGRGRGQPDLPDPGQPGGRRGARIPDLGQCPGRPGPQRPVPVRDFRPAGGGRQGRRGGQPGARRRRCARFPQARRRGRLVHPRLLEQPVGQGASRRNAGHPALRGQGAGAGDDPDHRRHRNEYGRRPYPVPDRRSQDHGPLRDWPTVRKRPVIRLLLPAPRAG